MWLWWWPCWCSTTTVGVGGGMRGRGDTYKKYLGLHLIDFIFIRASDGTKQVIDYEEGEGATTRLVDEGDDDERENVAEL